MLLASTATFVDSADFHRVYTAATATHAIQFIQRWMPVQTAPIQLVGEATKLEPLANRHSGGLNLIHNVLHHGFQPGACQRKWPSKAEDVEPVRSNQEKASFRETV